MENSKWQNPGRLPTWAGMCLLLCFLSSPPIGSCMQESPKSFLSQDNGDPEQ